MVFALNAGIALIFVWTLYRLLQQLGRGLRVGNIKGGWAHKGVAIRRSSEPLMYWMCVAGLGVGAAVFALLLGRLVSQWF